MNSGLQYTVIKPNGLNDAAAAQKELVVAHDDEVSPSSAGDLITAGDCDPATSSPSKVCAVAWDALSI